MTIKGDMVAALVSQGETRDRAFAIVHLVLGVASSADFAVRYERECDDIGEYYRVINFLKEMV